MASKPANLIKSTLTHSNFWPISDRIKPEMVVGKIDVWSAFSPASGVFSTLPAFC